MCFLEKINWELIFGLLGGTIIPSLLFYRQRKLDKDKEKAEKEEILKNDYLYFMRILKSSINDLESQAGFYKHYSEGFNNSLFGLNPFEVEPLYNLNLFLNFNHYKFYEAYIFHNKQGDIKELLKNFDDIFNKLSELEQINKHSMDNFYDLVEEYQPKKCEIYDDLFSEKFMKNVFEYKKANQNNDLILYMMECISVMQGKLNENANSNSNLNKNLSRDIEYKIQIDAVILIKDKISSSNEFYNNDLIKQILFDCIKLINYYHHLLDKSKEMETKFRYSHDEILKRTITLKGYLLDNI